MATKRICSIDDCCKPVFAKGWCKAHYKRYERHGTPLGGGKPRNKVAAPCKAQGCDQRSRMHGYCIKHFKRLQRNGSPEVVLLAKRSNIDAAKEVARASRVTVERLAEYRAWGSMRDRCANPKNKSFHNYGGRGISVCEQWQASFDAFMADMGPRPSPHHSIDRIDNDGNYTPENCRWTTQGQQMNNVRHNRNISIDGVSRSVAEWCRHHNISRSTFDARVRRGEAAESALSRPVRPKRRASTVTTA